jgi:hypothetical protein
MKSVSLDIDMLSTLQQKAFQYFIDMIQPETGLVADNTHDDPRKANITAVGLAIAVYIVGVERGFISREQAVDYTLTILRFFWNAPQGTSPDAAGFKGFYYRFLDVKTGRRADMAELSTVDTTYLLAGILAAAVYFDKDNEDETEIRQLADKLYRQVDWEWALNYGDTIVHGWTPENGFLEARWEVYSEGILIYLLALGSPTYPLSFTNYEAWTKTYKWRRIYGYELLDTAPLFTHQFPNLWVDFRDIQDAFMRDKQSDYFENSRRATYIQQAYAIRNPKNFKAYGEQFWGFTATDGPGDVSCTIDGIERQFHGYEARGVPNGTDDGTVSPFAVLISLPFAPEIVMPTLEHILKTYPKIKSKYGFTCSLNPTFPIEANKTWISEGHYALDEGPMVLMIENHFSEFLWKLMYRSPSLEKGLREAGFTGGWLDAKTEKS